MIKPYGSDELVNRFGSGDYTGKIDKSIVCHDDAILECMRIADGSLTPIEGFFSKEEMDCLIETDHFKNGTYFPIPIYLQIPGGMELKSETILIKDSNGNNVGYMENATTYKYDLKALCRYIFNTTDSQHPGVKRIIEQGDTFIGGKITMKEMENDLSRYCLSPLESRKRIEQNNWKSCVGFQTRNVPHRAHEYLQRIVMEVYDGLLIHPVIGWKKKNDYLPEVVMGAYEYMVNHVYPSSKVMLSGLQIAMRYAGPKEAVFHSIIRQNYGCTHFIVGRDHAGVGNYYAKYEAHEIFDRVQDYIDISIVKLKGPCYCSKCGSICTENTCGHDSKYQQEISGTMIRDLLLEHRYPPEFMMRKELIDLINTYERILI